MIELLLCSLFTILPDFLYRRYVQERDSAEKSRCIQSGSSCATE